MRSQVQVLAGPPAIVAGQSAAGSGPGAFAAGLGRAGAARPSAPAGPVAPSGPPTRVSGSATTTHRGRASSPETAATRRVQPPRAAACSRAHSAAARDGRSARRPGLAGRSVVKRGRRGGPHPPGGPGPPPTSSDQRDVGSVACVPASLTVDRAVDGSAATGASARSGGQGRPATSTWSPTPPLEHGRRRTRPDRRGQKPDGRTPDGWKADGWTLDGWTVDGRPPDPLDDDPR